MAPEDRNRNFEKALARHLRTSAPGGTGESAVPKMAACPDAETLAAFHERSLLPEEWDRVNLHVAGCSHCMTMLAQLEATDAIPLEAHSGVESQELAAASPVRAATAAAVSGPAGKSRRVLRLPGARWHYLAPAGALAAGLLVWIAIHGNRPMDTAMKQSVQVAEDHTAAPTVPPVSTTVPNAASEEKTKTLAPPTTHSELAARARVADAAKPAAALDDLSKDQTLTARNDAGATLSERESKLNKKEGVREADKNGIGDGQAGGARDQKVAGRTLEQEADALLRAQAQNNSQGNYSLSKVPGPAPLGQATMNRAPAAKSAPAADASSATPAALPPPSPSPSQPGTTGGQAASPSMSARKAAEPPAPPKPDASGAVATNYAVSNSSAALETVAGFANPRLITVPGSSLAWRVGRTGIIEFSRNDGSSWTRQSSGVTADLLTGSAPSDRTCWIVGRAGTILLTTDSGAHWKVLKPPFAEDFGGIRATDMLHATVWNARNTLNYQTTDGGATWTPVPNP